NQGSLTTTEGGFIVLAADRVKNSGNIRTPGGKTVLAAGDKVTLQLDNTGLASVSVSGSVVNALVENSGLLSATDGRVYLTARGKDMLLNTVVNNTGTVEASGLSGHGGEIVLNGGDSGVVSQSGTLLADSKTGHGGKITVEGQNIHLAANSRTSASGKTGGGEVYVGGGWQGKDSHIKNASQVVMSQGATIDVSATESGNGGRAVLWSDDYTNFRGDILAKGGSRSGHGGQVETSSHGNLQAFGDVDASAVAGRGGNWLLDPVGINITPDSASDVNVTTSESDNQTVFLSSQNVKNETARVKASTINEKLSKGINVIIKTVSGGESSDGAGDNSGDIKINAGISKTGSKEATLTLDADRNIIFEKAVGINAKEGSLNVNLYAARSVQGMVNIGASKRKATINTNGGDVMISRAPDAPGKKSLWVNITDGSEINAHNITMNAEQVKLQGGSLISSGDVKLTGKSGNEKKMNPLLINGSSIKTTGTISLNGETTVKIAKGVSVESSTLSAKSLEISGVNKAATGTGFSLKNITLGGGLMTPANIGLSSAGSAANVQNYLDLSIVKNGDYKTLINTWHPENLTSIGMASKALFDNSMSGWINDFAKDMPVGSGWIFDNTSVTAGGTVDLKGISFTNSKIHVTNGDFLLTNNSKLILNNDTVTVDNGGINAHSLNGNVEVNNSTISASNKISLHGETTVRNDTGVLVRGGGLKAPLLEILGVNKATGKGFSLDGTTLSGGIEKLQNFTFSSRGSSVEGVENFLGKGIIAADDINALLTRHPENLTRVNLGGNSVFNNAMSGWESDFTSDGTNGGWIFDNTSVTAGGTVDLKGIGFTNSTIHVTKGDLLLTNNSNLILNNDTVTVDDGGVNAHSLNGNVNLIKNNISASRDIHITADDGSVNINKPDTSDNKVFSIESTGGNIIIKADATKRKSDGVLLRNTLLSAASGEINVTGKTGSSETYEGFAGVKFRNDVTLDSKNNIVDGKSVESKGGGELKTAGVMLYRKVHVIFKGDTNINADSEGFSGILFNPRRESSQTLEFMNGSATIHALDKGKLSSGDVATSNDAGAMGISTWNGEDTKAYIKVSNATLDIIAESKGNSRGGISPYLQGYDSPNDKARGSAFIFSGDGDVSIKGVSEKGVGVDIRVLDNRSLNGKFTVTGESDSGTGIIIPEFADINVVNASISGSSKTGVGILINATDRNSVKVDFQGNTMSGMSESGEAGFQIKGKNVSIANGSVYGSVKSGPGAGVSFSGTGNFKVSSVVVKGESTEGTGVSADNLEVNDATIDGTGGKVGTQISGELTNNGNGKTSIHGSSPDGDGVQASGPVSLAGEFYVSGETDSGTAVNILAPLTTSEKTTIDGTATGAGTGVAVGPDVAVRKATINAFSRKGTGFKAGSGSTLDSVS
ncbi:hypothetical protein LHS21_005067, partial [Salmonella enterica subsp. enterica serovar Newport]|nr:hypothetical protein [Salmonella enterica subsp. enterica serovar Newport]